MHSFPQKLNAHSRPDHPLQCSNPPPHVRSRMKRILRAIVAKDGPFPEAGALYMQVWGGLASNLHTSAATHTPRFGWKCALLKSFQLVNTAWLIALGRLLTAHTAVTSHQGHAWIWPQCACSHGFLAKGGGGGGEAYAPHKPWESRCCSCQTRRASCQVHSLDYAHAEIVTSRDSPPGQDVYEFWKSIFPLRIDVLV